MEDAAISVRSLINEKSIHGKVKGNQYVPHVYLERQRSVVVEQYTTLGYIQFNWAKQMNVFKIFMVSQI